jgi:hypothetical protein
MFVVNFNEHVTVGLPNGIGFTNRFVRTRFGYIAGAESRPVKEAK